MQFAITIPYFVSDIFAANDPVLSIKDNTVYLTITSHAASGTFGGSNIVEQLAERLPFSLRVWDSQLPSIFSLYSHSNQSKVNISIIADRWLKADETLAAIKYFYSLKHIIEAYFQDLHDNSFRDNNSIIAAFAARESKLLGILDQNLREKASTWMQAYLKHTEYPPVVRNIAELLSLLDRNPEEYYQAHNIINTVETSAENFYTFLGRRNPSETGLVCMKFYYETLQLQLHATDLEFSATFRKGSIVLNYDHSPDTSTEEQIQLEHRAVAALYEQLEAHRKS